MYVVMDNATWGDYPVYIHQNKDGTEQGTRRYKVPSGLSGQLVREDGESLYWDGNNTQHIFHAWTQPDGVTLPDGATSGVVDLAKNNAAMEFLIGTRQGPLSYAENRQTVALKFDRLVSRIMLNTVTHNIVTRVSDGEARQLVKTITFPNLPSSLTFVTGIGTEEWPHLEEYPGAPTSMTMHNVRWWEKNYLYVAPFAFVETRDDGQGNTVEQFTGLGKFYVVYGKAEVPEDMKIYEGDLAEIAPYIKQLRAGEQMAIDLYLTDELITSMHVSLTPWNTKAVPMDIKANNGVYNENDFLELFASLANGKLPPDKFVTEVDGKKVIRLYSNFAFPDVHDPIFMAIPEGYVLDGMGYNIDCEKFSVLGPGEVRDLYINNEPVERQ